MAPPPPLTRIQAALLRASAELTELNLPFALVGGLAVSLRGEPRFTRDIDLAVSVASDRDAESIILALQAKRYRVFLLVEQESVGRIATVRLQADAEEEEGVVVDLLFASCGIETELVHAAGRLEVLPGVVVPVARAGHLIAMKVLSRDDKQRPQDAGDLRSLIRSSAAVELELAWQSVALIEQRGFQRHRDLKAGLQRAIDDARD